jgi:hypothetical protein
VTGFKPGDANADGPPQQAVYIDRVVIRTRGGK